MATVATERESRGDGQGATGRIVRIIGPVVDVEFAPDELPAIHNAITVERTLGDALVRAIAMQPTDGLIRGAPVTDTGGPMTMPVGEKTLGHVFNVLGRSL